jgi:hypothetical protein
MNWFEPPYIVTGGDFRPPVFPSVFLRGVLYTWNEIDWGIPSIYSPRILDPFFFFVTVFQTTGVNTCTSQLIATYLIYLLVAILVYLYVKRLTNGDIIVAFIAALFFTSNIHLIVDREQTAIGFIDMSLMILPCLVAFIEGLKKESYEIIAISGFLFTLTYGAFPNYRAPVLCLVGLLVTLFFMYINVGLGVGYHKSGNTKFLDVSFDWGLAHKYIKYLVVFIVAVLLASIWVMVLVSANFNVLLTAYSQTTVPLYGLYIEPHDVLRLIAKWSFYSGALGSYYTPYSVVYLNNPILILLSYVPPILAFAAVFVSRSRKLAIFFASVALVFLALTSGFTPSFYKLYAWLANNFPLMTAFREPTNWIFLVVLSCGTLIGLVVSTSYRRMRNGVLKLLVVGLIIALLFYISYPLFTGEVTENWLNTEIKGSYFPPYFEEAENAISDKYWTILLPQRATYVTYNFTNGGILACGNPYPLIFSKPILSGSGTEYIQSENLDVLNKAYELMLTSGYVNVAPEGNASASSVEKDGLVPAQAIDGDYNTRWASGHGMPQWFEIEWDKTQQLSKVKIFFENAHANDYTIETWNGSIWTTQIEVNNNTSLEPEYVFPQVVAATKLRINFTKALPFNMTSMWELETYTQNDVAPKFLGMLGIRDFLVEENIISGNLSEVKDLRLLDESPEIALVHEWDGASLYENSYALEKFYTADNVLLFSNLDGMYQLIDDSAWSTLQHSAIVNSTSVANWASQIGTLQAPDSFSWEEVSPTSYIAKTKSNSEFLLVFMESYDTHWMAFVNGSPISESNHVEVNAFANGWLVNATGNLTITVEYETQNLLTASVVASTILPAVLVMFLIRKKIREIAHNVLPKIRRRKTDFRLASTGCS